MSRTKFQNRSLIGPATLAATSVLAVAAAPAVAIPPAEPPMVSIEGGTYPIGSDAGRASARPAHEVDLAPFLIDAFEVTNAQYAAFLSTLAITPRRDVAAGALSRDDVAGPDAERVWGGPAASTRTYIELDDEDARIDIHEGRFVPSPGFADHPAPEVTWAGAVAFCTWRGARLPTEVEWEAAARGKQGRTYPWGEARPTPALAAFARARGDTAPVGSHPQGSTPEGVFDLAGNLAEWTSTLFRPYPYRADDGREAAGVAGERVTRGGDYVFDVAVSRLTGYFRDGFSRNPLRGHRHIGFRCARGAP